MSIIHWNIQSYRTNFSELKVLLNEHNPLGICLQETLIPGDKMNPPAGYSYIKSPKKRDDGHERGVAILISRAIHSKNVPLTTNLQAVATRLWIGKWYTVCSLYLPHDTLQLSDLENLVNQLPPPFLLLGDMNARSPLWGEPITNTKGRILENLLLRTDISLKSSNAKTHYDIAHDVYTTIDLSLCSPGCLLDFRHEVLESKYGSDHFPVKLALNIPVLEYHYPRRFKIEKADWAAYYRLTNLDTDPGEIQGIDDALTEICTTIMEAAEASIPRSNGRRKKPPVPWWNSDCRRARVEKLRAERALRRNPDNQGNKIAYKRCKAIFRRTANVARRDSWKIYISSINSESSMQKVWKRVKKMQGKYSTPRLPLLKTSTGDLVQEPQVTSNMFARAFSSVSSTNNYSDTFKSHKLKEEKRHLNFDTREEHDYNLPFSLSEFKHCLSLTSESSPGIDKITYSMIKNSHPSLQRRILQIFNHLYKSFLFPTEWGTAIVIAMERAGKDTTEPLESRPISLTSCLGKLMERMVNPRLMWILEKLKVINPAQSGFRKNRSTTDCLAKFQNDIQGAISRGEHALAVFFDLTKAYDMAWRHGILSELHRIGLRGSLPKFIENFLSNRKIVVRVGDTLSEPCTLEEGTPQGSVISCTLFMIAINQISKNLPTEVQASLYVDDYAIYAYGRLPHIVERRLQVAINHIQIWSGQTGFVFSQAKTVSMHICRKRRCQRSIETLTLNGTKIPCVESHTFLGLKIDHRLSWQAHISDLKRSCYKKLELFKFLSRKKWGADTKMLLRLFIVLIKPKIDYGVEAYGMARESLLRMLDPILNEAIRIATGAFRSSPTPSLLAISGLKPLSTYREVKTLNYFLRAAVTQSNPLNEQIQSDRGSYEATSDDEEVDQRGSTTTTITFLENSRNLMRKYRINLSAVQLEPIPDFPPWITGGLTTCTELDGLQKNQQPPQVLKGIFLDHLRNHQDSAIIYTDGSKTDEGVAYAVSGEGSHSSHRIDGSASVFTAELLAILKAIRTPLSDSNQSITIVSDSKSSIQAINKLYPTNPIVNQIRKAILDSGRNVALCWVPSHIGVPGNEEADSHAREATSSANINQLPLPRSDIKSFIRQRARNFWERKWQQENLTNKLREITDSTSPLPNSCCSNREWERGLVRLRIGHCLMTHGHVMAGGRPPECGDCNVDLTIKHVMIECPNFETQRRLCLPNYRPTMKYFLSEADTSFGGPVHSFLRTIGVLNKL